MVKLWKAGRTAAYALDGKVQAAVLPASSVTVKINNKLNESND